MVSLNVQVARDQPLKVNPYQENMAMRFIAYLELKIPDSALLLMDAKQAMNDIEAVKSKTYTSTMLERDLRGMYYRCRYYNPKDKYPNFYEVEVFFSDTGEKK